ncbi:MAG: hypothetical protein ACK4NW_04775 [Roseinatronobacter sp.]
MARKTSGKKPAGATGSGSGKDDTSAMDSLEAQKLADAQMRSDSDQTEPTEVAENPPDSQPQPDQPLADIVPNTDIASDSPMDTPTDAVGESPVADATAATNSGSELLNADYTASDAAESEPQDPDAPAPETDAVAPESELPADATSPSDQSDPEPAAPEVSVGPITHDPVEPATPPAEPVAATPPPPPTPAPPAKSGFFPLLIGGLVAGGIGYGAHYFLASGQDDTGAEVAALQAEVQQLRAALTDLPGAPDLSAVEAEISDLRSALDSLDISAQVTAGMDSLRAEFAASEDVGPDTQLMAQLNEMSRDLSQNSDRLTSLEGDLSDRDEVLAALQAELAEIRDIAERRVAEAEASVDAALARAGLDLMQSALATGAPYPQAIALLRDAGVVVPEPLAQPAATGVPTLEMLQESYPAAARAALRAALQDDTSGGAAARIENFLRAQLGVRSTAPREGDDPDAVLSRAAAHVEAGDLDAALGEIETLPAPARDALERWRLAAQSRRDADAAFADFATTLSNR